MSWSGYLIAYRDGSEVELSLEAVEAVLARHGVPDPGQEQRLHRDPSAPDDLWTDFTVDEQAVCFESPADGSVWQMIFDLMVTCGAGLTDSFDNVVVPSEAIRQQLPSEDSFNSVFVATSVDELVGAPWPPDEESEEWMEEMGFLG